MTHCRKITFEMQGDSNDVWEQVFTMENVQEIVISHEFLPKTYQEKITVTIIRRNRQTEEVAAYNKFARI